jgi:hypothetical protein
MGLNVAILVISIATGMWGLMPLGMLLIPVLFHRFGQKKGGSGE